MICWNCKAENEVWNKFCANCGSNLLDAPPSPPDVSGNAGAVPQTGGPGEAQPLTQALMDTAPQAPAGIATQAPAGTAAQALMDTAPQAPAGTATQAPETAAQAPELMAATPKPGQKPLNWLFAAVCAALALLVSGTALGYWLLTDDLDIPLAYEESAAASQESAQTAVPVLKSLYIPTPTITLTVGQSKQVPLRYFPQSADAPQLEWAVDGDGIVINENGVLRGLTAGQTAAVLVTDKATGLSARADVKVLTPEENFFETIQWLSHLQQNRLIDLYAANFTPNPVAPELKTLESGEDIRRRALDVFNLVNSELPSYSMTQKQFVNQDTQNKMDFDVYREPVSGDIRKIVTIEYIGDVLEIVDYYFVDGKVGFIFKRNENYYRPVSANWGIPGSRYYFDNDAMVTWRQTQKNGEDFTKTDFFWGTDGMKWAVTTYHFDYASGNTLDNVDWPITMGDSDEIQKQKQAEYYAEEQRMLNAALNVYNKVCETPDIAKVEGYVLRQDGQPMAGALIKVFSNEYNVLVSQTYSQDDGFYSFWVPFGNLPYTVTFEASGYLPVTLYNVVANDMAINGYQQNIFMIRNDALPMRVYLNLLDAMTGGYFDSSGTYLLLRNGVGNISGLVEQTIYLDNHAYDFGLYELYLNPGNYTGELVSYGRESSFFTISTLYDGWRIQNSVVPEITNDEVKIVLSWGSEPYDLDSHLFFPDGKHIAYYTRQQPGGNLDVDMMDGYGPETITLYSSQNGTYKYYVADYTNCSQNNYTSRAMSFSSANVSVYTKDGLIGSFYVPRNAEGVIWHVFNISNGQLVPVQRYFNNVQDMEWWSAYKPEDFFP